MSSLYAFSLLFCLSFQYSRANFQLQILHTNDIHSRFLESDTYGASCPESLSKNNQCYGGFARIRHAVVKAQEKARSLKIPSIFLNAGDNFQGTPYYMLYKWKIVADLIQTLGIDVMCLGNHEFDNGIDNLVNFLKHITIPHVATNLNRTSEERLNLPILKSSVILDLNTTKIGVIGALTPETVSMSNTENLEIFDEIPYLRREARHLKENGIHIILALTHSGFSRDIEIATEVKELSMIIGGHSHSLLYTPKDKPPSTEMPTAEYPYMVTHESGKKIPIVQAGCNGKYLGEIIVTFDKNGTVIEAEGNSRLLDYTIKKDPGVEMRVVAWTSVAKVKLRMVQGYTRVFLKKTYGSPSEVESNLGNLITDALVDYGVQVSLKQKSKDWTDSPIAIYLAGGIRSRLDNTKNDGALTLEDLMTTLPWEDDLIQADYKGSTIKAAIEFAVADKDEKQGGFRRYLFSSGLKIIYDFDGPSGSRVKNITVICKHCSVPTYEPLQMDKVYSLIMGKYVVNGGDKFDMFKNERLSMTFLNVTDTDVVVNYIKKLKIVYPYLEGRITLQRSDSTSAAQKISSFSILLFVILTLGSISYL